MKTKSLKDFLQKYINDKAASLGAEGYADWISKNGADPELIRAQSTLKANSIYKTALPTYGAKAETLADSGLAGSGYAEFIGNAAKARLEQSSAAIKSEHLLNEAQRMSDYKDYLSDTEKAEKKLYQTVYTRIRSEKIPDFERAYLRALRLGLRAEAAYDVATKATESVRADLKYRVAEKIISNSLTSYQTVLYAVSLGLSEEEARELGKLAHDINQTAIGGTEELPEGYLNYLKELESIQKGEH